MRSSRARSGSASASGSSAAIPRRSSPAAAWRTSTRWAGCSSTSRRRRRTSTAPRSSLVTGIPEDKIHVDLARHRRRLRQQGAGLPRLRVRDRRRAETRTAGQVDRDADREPHVAPVSRATTTWTSSSAPTADGRLTALSVSTAADHGAFDAAADPHASIRPACSASSPAATTSRSRTRKWTRTSPTRRRAASRIAARSG